MFSKNEILKKYWGYDHFRLMQENIIDSVLQDIDCIALLPTGAGKSLCYQIPALMMEGVCIVISPLISLMQDQVLQLQEKDIPAQFIHGGLSYQDIEDILEQAYNGYLKLLYVSPERLFNKQFQDWSDVLPINLIAIDEAHCISQWGYNFRPEYLKIKSYIDSLSKNVSVIALTATATIEVLEDIKNNLSLTNASLFRQSFERSNIEYQVIKTNDKLPIIITECTNSTSTIIYCRNKRLTEEIALILKQNNIQATYYHSGVSNHLKEKNQESWMSNVTPVMVATTAFGMGINKADVRCVIHYDIPENIESYYQETGRAGRDGQMSKAIILFNESDCNKLRSNIQYQFPKIEYLRIVYHGIANYFQIPIGVFPQDYFNLDLADFCQKFNFNRLQTTYALKLLAQEGLWNINESVYKPAYIQIIVTRNSIDSFSKQYQYLGKVIEAMLRLYTGVLLQMTSIYLFDIARYLKIDKVAVHNALMQLKSLGIIKYQEAQEGTFLYFNHTRVEAQHLQIDTYRLMQLKKSYESKIESMINYLYNLNDCRNKQLLNYFGEQQSKEVCNHCDYCNSKNIKPNTPIIKNYKEIIVGLLKTYKVLTPTQINLHLNQELSITKTQIRQLIDQKVLMLNLNGSISLYQ